MRILFIILAHNDASHLADLAGLLARAGSGHEVMIHFDANARPRDWQTLNERVATLDRVHLVTERVACRWGDYSLVHAVVTAMYQAQTQHIAYDYAVLLSGACLPCRPIRQLERFFEERDGTEFIEAHGPEWMIGGYRQERYERWFLFPPAQNGSKFEHFIVTWQGRLGVRRIPPLGMTVRFGSQWWALTRKTCEAILALMKENPEIESFFRRTYIPDEMVFPTLVNYVVDSERIGNFSITHFQFTDRGKPTVFYDDHRNYPFLLQRFFYRKVSSEALALRQRSFEIARASDDGSELTLIGAVNNDYDIKASLQTNFPQPAAMFYRDQLPESPHGTLDKNPNPYLVVVARDDHSLNGFARCLDEGRFFWLGRSFAANRVEFGDKQDLAGLHADDYALRDLNPAQYLVRLRSRCGDRVPVFGWMPGDNERMLNMVKDDQRCLLISRLLTPQVEASLISLNWLEPAEGRRLEQLLDLGDGSDASRAHADVGRGLLASFAGIIQNLPDELFSEGDGFHDGRLLRDPDMEVSGKRLPPQLGADFGSARFATTLCTESAAASAFRRFAWFDCLKERLLAQWTGETLTPVRKPAKARSRPK